MSTSEEAPAVQPAPPAAAKKPVIATAYLQRWEGDNAVDVGRVSFDARPVLGVLTTEDTVEFRTSPERGDDLFHKAVKHGLVPPHDGPFYLDVADAIDEALALDPTTFDEPHDDSRTARHPETVLKSPLSPYEIGMWVDADGFITGLSAIDLGQLIDNDVEEVNDLLGELLVGAGILMQPTATPVRVDADGTLVARVTGDASMIIDGFFGDELDAYEAGLALNPSGGPAAPSEGAAG